MVFEQSKGLGVLFALSCMFATSGLSAGNMVGSVMKMDSPGKYSVGGVLDADDTGHDGGNDSYPAMSRFYVVDLDQQNRYLESVEYSYDGISPVSLFVCSKESELPFVRYNKVNEKQADGAVIDKTSFPVVLPEGTRSFTMKFHQYAKDIIIQEDGADIVCHPELVWTTQSAYIDWNNNRTFDADEIYPAVGGQNEGDENDFGDAEGNVRNGWSRTFSIPENVGAGDYRMRVVYMALDYPVTSENLFSEYSGEIRNGVAYDFTLRISSMTSLDNISEDNMIYYEQSSETLHSKDKIPVSVYDLSGRLVMESCAGSSLSVSSLPPGVYVAVGGGHKFKFAK